MLTPLPATGTINPVQPRPEAKGERAQPGRRPGVRPDSALGAQASRQRSKARPERRTPHSPTQSSTILFAETPAGATRGLVASRPGSAPGIKELEGQARGGASSAPELRVPGFLARRRACGPASGRGGSERVAGGRGWPGRWRPSVGPSPATRPPAPRSAGSPCRGSFLPARAAGFRGEPPNTHIPRGSLGPCSQVGRREGGPSGHLHGGRVTDGRGGGRGRPRSCRRESSALPTPTAGGSRKRSPLS